MTEGFTLHRDEFVDRATSRREPWDVLIIGGGATGLGAAVDAASRGYATLLLEQSDFGKGTSSRSTKLVHGGVRYLQQGNLSLVYEALRERGRLLRNAPHLTESRAFVIPCYRWWDRPFYGIGLKIYDAMARKWSLGGSTMLSRRATSQHLPTVRKAGLRGGVRYYDGQFDDARLAINLAQTAAEHGAVVLNYVRVDGLTRSSDRISGAVATEMETGREWIVPARVVVNATGVFVDSVRRMDRPDVQPMVRPSQGAHIVLDRSFLPGEAALMIPRTDDGRVLFAVPWNGRVVVGTTDTPRNEVDLEPAPLEDEIAFLIDHASRYLDRAVGRGDVRSVFAGLRPLVSGDAEDDTAAISRDHVLCVSRSGLVTITGGKWTTYRKMAEDTIDRAAEVGSLQKRPCATAELPIHGWTADPVLDGSFSTYGADAQAVRDLVGSTPDDDALVHPDLSLHRGEVRWAARHEMARTVEDVLARRTRSLLLDARASAAAAESVAAILAEELGRDPSWLRHQVAAFRRLCTAYTLDAPHA